MLGAGDKKMNKIVTTSRRYSIVAKTLNNHNVRHAHDIVKEYERGKLNQSGRGLGHIFLGMIIP